MKEDPYAYSTDSEGAEADIKRALRAILGI